MNTEYQKTWELYAASWKAASEAERRGLFDMSLDSACVYSDPMTKTTGWDALLQYMAEFHKQIPGGHFVTTRFFAHNNKSAACWNMVTGDGTVIGDGVSFGEYSDTGRLTAMTGFFEPPPS